MGAWIPQGHGDETNEDLRSRLTAMRNLVLRSNERISALEGLLREAHTCIQSLDYLCANVAGCREEDGIDWSGARSLAHDIDAALGAKDRGQA